MQPTQTNKKKNDLNGVKYFLMTLSLAATIGLWNLFSNKINGEAAAANPAANPPPQTAPVAMGGFPPLPTLVPMKSVSSMAAIAPSSSKSSTTLRQVNIPTPQPTLQNARPVFEQVIVNSSSNNSGGGGGGGGPVAKTGSSK
jgi:hypothetical protein